MIFEIHQPSAPLNQHIESMVYFKDYIAEHSIERVVPTGNSFLIFEFDDFIRHTYDDDLNPNGAFEKSWISGTHQKYLNISVHQRFEMMAIQFKPMGAFPFLKFSMDEISHKVIAATQCFDASINDVRDKIKRTEPIAEKFRLMETWLTNQLDESKSAPEEIIQLCNSFSQNSFTQHQDLVKNYPKTQKHLIHQFKKYGGLTPKILHRIFRFNTILSIIQQREVIHWADISYETGYSDQSHFIKEFQEFCGFNPSRFIQQYPNETPLNFMPLNQG